MSFDQSEWKEAGARSTQVFEAMAKDAVMTLNEIRETACLTQFREEYENLHAALRKAHENERRLIKKSKELAKELHSYQSKVSDTMQQVSGNQELCIQLTADIKGLERKISDNTEKVTTKRELCESYEAQINALHASDQNGVTQEDHMKLQNLTLQKELGQREVDRAEEDAHHLTMVSERTAHEVSELLHKVAKGEAHIQSLREKINEKRRETEEITTRRSELEKDIDDLTMQSEENRAELRAKQQAFSHETQILAKIDQANKDMAAEESRLESEYKRTQEDIRLTKLKVDDENKRVRTSAHENDVKAEILKEKKAAQKALRKDIEVRVEGMIETLKEKMTEADAEKKEIEEQRADWREKITEAEAASTRMAKECEADQKRIESLLRERDILNKNVVKADERTKQQIELVRNKETEVAQLRKDITKWKAEAQEFRKKIFQMEKQREKVAVDLSVANSKYYAGLEELKARDERLGEIHKQIGDVNTKLANQKNLYDAVVADRNVYSKNLIESNEEIATMDVQFKVMYNDIGQVKDEIREKDHTLVREKFEEQKLAKNNEAIKESLERAKKRLGNLNTIIETQQNETKKLEKVIATAESEKLAQQKDCKGVYDEKGVLVKQLIKRNEELENLYEKLKVQQSKLLHGENEYKAVCDSVVTMQKQIDSLKDEVVKCRSQMSSTTNIKRQIHSLERELIHEQCKVKHLEEEMKNPMNVHRWRRLEGSDPQAYELMHSIKTLQKRLIGKTEEVIECDMLIQEKEKLYVQLKNILARQPGPEVAEQLQWYTRSLKEKTAQMRAMAAELSGYHKSCEDLRMDLSRYKNELQHAKNEYFARRRRG
eukprot:CAMPEP_0178992684 /NCGR_PEP_ID=MMETSP0795-20121207/6257_1 /TAXON_ID=88552 /ORGANISM="Amoebophrya sp., Strain Ameob2" /LENGTH=835 /DNA_ID=CAMNT_0020684605 /DNA_START=199 /DNA_END=2703 /DNA_ORIENTATION=+